MKRNRNIHKVVLSTAGVLFLIVLFLTSCSEAPTISEKWGTVKQMENALVYEQKGLKDGKYYENAAALVQQLKNIKGFVGIETFIKSQTVKIFYDPALIIEKEVKEALFTPSTIMLNEPNIDKIGVMEIRVLNYFDSTDEFYMTELLSSDSSIFGYTSSYGEPIHLKIYFNPDSLQPSEIMAIIETEEVKVPEGNNETIHKLDFEVQDEVVKPSYVNPQEFYEVMAPPMDDTFNNFENYKTSELAVYQVPVTLFNNDSFTQLGYLESQLSNDEGIVGFKTVYQKDSVFIEVTYVKDKTKPLSILKQMQAEKLKVYYNDSTSEDIDNLFKFVKQGKVINPE